MKPVYVNSTEYIDSSGENNEKVPKSKINDHLRILKYEKIFSKDYVPNWSEEVFVIKELKVLFHEHILSVILTVKELLECFTKTNCKRQTK